MVKICFNKNNNFNHPIDNLPTKLTYLHLSSKFDQSVDNLPKNLNTLYLSRSFSKPVDNLPPNLKYLYIYSCHFKHSLDNLPNNLTHLFLDDSYYNYIKHLPNSLKYLQTYSNILQNCQLPNSLETIKIYSDRTYAKLQNLPSNIQIKLTTNSTANLPPYLTYLELKNYFNEPIQTNHLPKSLKTILFPCEKYPFCISDLPSGINVISHTKNYDKLCDNIYSMYPKYNFENITNLL